MIFQAFVLPVLFLAVAVMAAAQTRDTARIRILLPDAQARVWMDGKETKATGTDRFYDTPKLIAGGNSAYRIKASWMQQGREMAHEQYILVAPGQLAVLDLARPVRGKSKSLDLVFGAPPKRKLEYRHMHSDQKPRTECVFVLEGDGFRAQAEYVPEIGQKEKELFFFVRTETLKDKDGQYDGWVYKAGRKEGEQWFLFSFSPSQNRPVEVSSRDALLYTRFIPQHGRGSEIVSDRRRVEPALFARAFITTYPMFSSKDGLTWSEVVCDDPGTEHFLLRANIRRQSKQLNWKALSRARAFRP